MEDKILCDVSDLEPIADAVREKENTNKLYSVEELKVKVPELIGSGSEIELPILTNPATASDALSGKEFIDGNGNKVTGTITTVEAKTIIPSMSSQTAVAKNVYTTDIITVAAIPDQYEDRTESLPKLNAMNGGTAATTIAAAVDNTQAHASEQETLISDIDTALENLGASGGVNIETCTVMIEYQTSSGGIPVNVSGTVAYVDQTHTPAVANGKLVDTMIDVTYQVAKDTVLFARSGSSYYHLTTCEGEIEQLYSNSTHAAFAIHGDGKIILAEQ